LPRLPGRINGPARGLTLLELILTAGTVGIAVAGLLPLFAFCLLNMEGSGQLTTAMAEAHNQLEEVRSTAFEDLVEWYGAEGTGARVFHVPGLHGAGVVLLDVTDPDLIAVEVVVCWRRHDGAVMGEDENLNGRLDGAEDLNGNGKLDSPASLATLLARRE
jgi:hypothetical protein